MKHPNTIPPKSPAFSLVELSIVLVILGLLAGGVLAGQSLIRAAELRSSIAGLQKYQTAIMAFREKYFGLPGDITNATAFWGKDATSSAACPGQSGTAATPGTCNGDGDGVITGNWGEPFRAWQQLAMAGLIEGTYVGTAYNWGLTGTKPGVDYPVGKIPNSGYSFSTYQTLYTDISSQYNYLTIGAVTTSQPWGGLFTPEEAWSIDTKIDDGLPGKGQLMANATPNWCTTTYLSTSTYQIIGPESANKTCFLSQIISAF